MCVGNVSLQQAFTVYAANCHAWLNLPSRWLRQEVEEDMYVHTAMQKNVKQNEVLFV